MLKWRDGLRLRLQEREDIPKLQTFWTEKRETGLCRQDFCRSFHETRLTCKLDCLVSLFFHVLHLAVIAGNMTGWAIHRARRIHLALVSVTLFSWIVLGYRYGLGYCFLTEWHWQVLESQGVSDLPGSYIAYLIRLLTGLSPDPRLVDAGTGACFAFAVCASLYVNRDLFIRQR